MLFAYANEMMGASLQFKRGLQPPSARVIRQAEQQRGRLLYDAADIRKLVAAAPPHLKAMILLGINCAFGPDDCVRFSWEHINNGFHNFPRNKTSIERRCPLWPETKKALAALSASDGHVFNGRRWDSFIIAKQFAFCCEAAGVKNLGFYSLRRTFQTIATTAPVNSAIASHIMGHARKANDMAGIYRQQVFDSQLLECVNHVRKWYLGKITL
jgi:integrase